MSEENKDDPINPHGITAEQVAANLHREFPELYNADGSIDLVAVASRAQRLRKPSLVASEVTPEQAGIYSLPLDEAAYTELSTIQTQLDARMRKEHPELFNQDGTVNQPAMLAHFFGDGPAYPPRSHYYSTPSADRWLYQQLQNPQEGDAELRQAFSNIWPSGREDWIVPAPHDPVALAQVKPVIRESVIDLDVMETYPIRLDPKES